MKIVYAIIVALAAVQAADIIHHALLCLIVRRLWLG